MEVARSLGISVKRLYGWEPTQTTVREYENRRLVRLVTTTEPEWDDAERNWQLALAELEAQSCGGCGYWLADTMGLENDGRWVADPPKRCHRCNALEERRREVRERTNVLHPAALTVWPVTERR